MTARARGRQSRGAGQPAAGAAGPRDPNSLEELRQKYLQLCLKYEALVARTSARTSERIGAVALALGAMRASPSALALADAERILFTNARWTRLAREQRALARLRGPDVLPARGTVRQIADAGTTCLLRSREPETIAARYEAEGGAAAWDFRFERTQYRGTAVAMIVATDAVSALRDERELERTRRRSAGQERLRTVGLFAAGIAHDFANALNAAGLHLGLVAGQGDALAEPARRHVHAVRRILAGMGDRTRRLRELALERHELAIERVELAGVVAAAVDLARAEFRSRGPQAVEIEVQPEVDALPPVRGAGTEVVHLLLNLFLNARDAMPRGGTIHVGGAAEPDAVRLEVVDEGPGIPEAHLARVFEPFFTTKGDEGTGLGLATGYGLMRTLDGEITAANRPAGGAVFALRFRRWS